MAKLDACDGGPLVSRPFVKLPARGARDRSACIRLGHSTGGRWFATFICFGSCDTAASSGNECTN